MGQVDRLSLYLLFKHYVKHYLEKPMFLIKIFFFYHDLLLDNHTFFVWLLVACFKNHVHEFMGNVFFLGEIIAYCYTTKPKIVAMCSV